ncbi:L,D-transpeptidase [Billgrantia gudaonensis]|uniref:L,D-transpeptidase n=1 Tax=Billgrantia gudaonensis TaxID=376427 RepID=A0A3S0QRI4_9GAMM|nr:L,D-transpeptidase [Halomonas gudaonensis]
MRGRRPAPRVETYPIGIGREASTRRWADQRPPCASRIRHGTRRIGAPRGRGTRREAPGGAAGPDNPLGDHAILLGFDGYLIHGTNRPDGIGMRASRGCIRMFPEDIESMFERIRWALR